MYRRAGQGIYSQQRLDSSPSRGGNPIEEMMRIQSPRGYGSAAPEFSYQGIT